MKGRVQGLALTILVSVVCSLAQADGNFPMHPDERLTPGSVCHHADAIRYPERIKYCNRDVSGSEKAQIFRNYDNIGFRTRSMERRAFKIDHYIPLCAGGSNDESNLWPQHESVYVITDKLEELVCQKMAEGRLKQKDAIEYIRRAKNNLDEAPDIEEEVRGL